MKRPLESGASRMHVKCYCLGGPGRAPRLDYHRVFEHTDDEISARFMPNGKLDIVAVMQLPTIFMNEGIGDEIARVGWLTRIEQRANEYLLQCSYDGEIPSLTNGEIYAMAGELQMINWEFSRNHWAIKDVDLFQLLYRRRVGQRPLPRVFQLSANPVKAKLVTFMMPFSGEFSAVYQTVKSTLEAEGFRVSGLTISGCMRTFCTTSSNSFARLRWLSATCPARTRTCSTKSG